MDLKKRENIFSLMNATNCTDKTKLGLSQQKTYGGGTFFLYTGTQTITFASGATNFPPTPPPIQLRKQQFPTQEFILVLGNEQATYKKPEFVVSD